MEMKLAGNFIVWEAPDRKSLKVLPVSVKGDSTAKVLPTHVHEIAFEEEQMLAFEKGAEDDTIVVLTMNEIGLF